jgi:chromosomal replication initiation ATPase DnaA
MQLRPVLQLSTSGAGVMGELDAQRGRHRAARERLWPSEPPKQVARRELADVIGAIATLRRELTHLRGLLHAKGVLEDSDITGRGKVSCGVIRTQVACFYGIALAQLNDADRREHLVQARHVAIYLCRRLTRLSMPDIGRCFRRDRTSVLHAVRKIERLRPRDEKLDRALSALEHRLVGDGTEGEGA